MKPSFFAAFLLSIILASSCEDNSRTYPMTIRYECSMFSNSEEIDAAIGNMACLKAAKDATKTLLGTFISDTVLTATYRNNPDEAYADADARINQAWAGKRQEARNFFDAINNTLKTKSKEFGGNSFSLKDVTFYISRLQGDNRFLQKELFGDITYIYHDE